ncbi:ABC transporter substrate-binding protein [Bacillus sp. B15-48]|uniref:ABC transporter substrate-binding protein n=1 Tax=Bacillus sp. B15-48 TaxID=1548601 RepID=UPI00193F1F57|nr:ABC transporter substrate-binding protein [Bacillus sp. B15-48]MBM4762966.1 ABC transporter substrate-binding protein [Bacillus sp. B15-48]
MKLKNGYFFIILCLFLIAGCSAKNEQSLEEETSRSVLEKDWETIVSDAKGSTVNFYLWGGDEGINRYIDGYIAPQLKEEYEISLKRQPMDAVEFINKLITEKQAEKAKGVMDVIWINGENFKTAKQHDLLLGPITAVLPHFQQYVDAESPEVKYDFGFPTDGYEAPWGKVQFVFTYDSSKMENPPKTLQELEKWVQENPGKFTYPAPPDFTGSAFIRHLLNETSGDYSAYLNDFNEELIEQEAEEIWETLNRMKRYLWREGTSYPQSLAQLNQLYKNGEVWLTMGYDEAGTSNLIENGEFPETSRTYVLEKGTLANTHFLAVPYNAPNPEAALVVINHFLSPDAQLKKMDITYWGENTALTLDLLPEDMKQAFEEIDRGSATLSEEELSEHRLPEISSEYVEWLERGWIENVANN